MLGDGVAMSTNEPKVMRCPKCGSSGFDGYFMAPMRYVCKSCGARYEDANGIRVLTEEEGRKLRPGMYGDPVCTVCCSHAPHAPGACPFCDGTTTQERPNQLRALE